MTTTDFQDLVTTALGYYALQDVQLTRLGGADNVTFRVHHSGGTALLRLHTSGRLSPAEIAAELMWLRHLHAADPAAFAHPLPATNGELVTAVSHPDGSTLYCSLLSWVSGEPVAGSLPAGAAPFGALLARLHQQARQFQPPTPFHRPNYHAAYFAHQVDTLEKALSPPPPAHAAALAAIVNSGIRLAAFLHQLPTPADDFGLIHADFHPGNYLWHNDQARIIDFDRCGWGYFAFDLAAALIYLPPVHQETFRQGYETVLPLPPLYQAHPTVFTTLAFLDNLAFLAANPADHAFVWEEIADMRPTFAAAADYIHAYLP